MAKQLAFFWLDSSKHKCAFYIGLKIKDVDRRIQLIKLPKTIKRNPRSIVERNTWKANEWRSYLLYYSIGIFYKILPTNILRHYGKFISALWTFLGDCINPIDIDKMDQQLIEFVKFYQVAYGKKHMTYNLHTLLHLAQCVRDLGPLWSYSNFPFENNNGKLEGFVKSPKGVIQQILNKYTWNRYLGQPHFSQYVNEYKKKIYQPTTTSLEINRVLGSCKKINKNVMGMEFLENFNDLDIVFSFNRMVHEHVEYTTKSYSSNIKSNDSVVQLIDHCYGEIVYILKNGMEIFVILDIFNVIKNHELSKICPHITVIDNTKLTRKMIPVKDILHKCVFIDLDIVKYVTKYIDFLDKD